MAEQVFSGASPALSADDGACAPMGPATSRQSARLTNADIQMWLRFDLGSACLSLQEIEQLTPGQTLLLTSNPDMPVELKCCGEKIAMGRLVHVNGQLAVQVAQLLSAHDGDHRERVE